MYVLGIETSCDDTAASVVLDGKRVLSNVSVNQDAFHQKYQGVVPEIASRKHLETMLPVIDEALINAQLNLKKIDVIAVTTHPGLMGALLIGVNTAKGLSQSHRMPLIAVNHLKAHLYALNLTHAFSYPILGLIVSGGHTLLVKANSPLDIEVLGTTIDDACGECFDKVAKYLKLGYPGGPIIDKLSQKGNTDAIPYPVYNSKKSDNAYNFSYSGLKTAVIYQTQKLYGRNSSPNIEDICASFQKAALVPLVKKAVAAARNLKVKTIGICGGVSANTYFRELLSKEPGIEFIAPELKYCPDNAAMVAGLAYHQAKENDFSSLADLIPSSRPIRPKTLATNSSVLKI